MATQEEIISVAWKAGWDAAVEAAVQAIVLIHFVKADDNDPQDYIDAIRRLVTISERIAGTTRQEESD